jgi:hypothetical protein
MPRCGNDDPTADPSASQRRVIQVLLQSPCERGAPPSCSTGAPCDTSTSSIGSALYEEDHLIPLELDGAQRNPKNLWPEPPAQAKRSDPLETSLRRQVCRGFMRLATARAAIKAFKFRYG